MHIWLVTAIGCGEAPDGSDPGGGSSPEDTDTVPESPPEPPVVETGDTGSSTTTCADTGLSALAGEWVGDCPIVATSPAFGELTMTLTLAESCGDVTGDARLDYTQVTYYGGTTGGGGTPATEAYPVSLPLGTRGAFDGAVAVLAFRLPNNDPFPGLELTATLDGDALAGPLEYSPYGTWVESYGCALTRQ